MKHGKMHEVFIIFITPKYQGNKELVNVKYVIRSYDAFGSRPTTLSSYISNKYRVINKYVTLIESFEIHKLCGK